MLVAFQELTKRVYRIWKLARGNEAAKSVLTQGGSSRSPQVCAH